MSDSKPADQREPRTVVEQGTRIRGTLASSCPVDVHGHIEGDVETPALYVSATGALHGRAKVGVIRSDGELSGELDADHIELAGRVLDKTVIRARSLQVNLASDAQRLQVIFGECELSVGDEPMEPALEMERRAQEQAQQAAAADLPSIAAAPSSSAEASSEAASPAEMQAQPEPPPMLPPAREMAEAGSAAASAMEAAPAEASPAGASPAEASATDAVPAEASSPADASSSSEAAASDVAVPMTTGAVESDEASAEPKQRRKRKNGGMDDRVTGWSHPPSQPPPAS